MASEQDPWHMRLVVFIVTRLIYFSIGFVLFFLGISHSMRTLEFDNTFPLFWNWKSFAACMGMGVVAAVIGPALYNIESTRGRGTLSEIRKNSHLDDDDGKEDG